MPHFVYIIYSPAKNRYYVGESAFPENRIAEHNTGKYIGAYTKAANDWCLKKLVGCTNRKDALVVERYIKSMKSKKFIAQIINDEQFFLNFKNILKERFNIEIH